jgi:hypothetical protein
VKNIENKNRSKVHFGFCDFTASFQQHGALAAHWRRAYKVSYMLSGRKSAVKRLSRCENDNRFKGHFGFCDF